METIPDFEDMLSLLDSHRVRYLIVGGLAFTYHVKPRFTKDLDLWLDPSKENLRRANRALAEFGAPNVLDLDDLDEILQVGVAPDRIDLMKSASGIDFESCWKKRVLGRYGEVEANWIDLDSLIEIKSRIDDPRHQADARELRKVKERREKM